MNPTLTLFLTIFTALSFTSCVVPDEDGYYPEPSRKKYRGPGSNPVYPWQEDYRGPGTNPVWPWE